MIFRQKLNYCQSRSSTFLKQCMNKVFIKILGTVVTETVLDEPCLIRFLSVYACAKNYES